MFPMMTPIDAISLSLRAGMMFGQTQTLWLSRMMEMQSFWAGYPNLAVAGVSGPVPEAAPEVDAEDAAPVVLAPLTEIHVEAMAAVPSEPLPVPAPEADTAPPSDPVFAEVLVAPIPEAAPPAPLAAAPAANPKRPRKPAPLAE